MRILINCFKKDNYIFADTKSGVYVDLVQVMSTARCLTPALEIAIKAGKVIDVDNAFNVEVSEQTKQINDYVVKRLNVAPLKVVSEMPKESERERASDSVAVEEPAPKEETKKKSKAKSKKDKVSK